ncbi:DNA recombination protein RmuC [Sphingomonas flavalba]|uniref:DNA recombination protein RmuC n=1 Tax=Sphingomonas flavalba TaxID=2559804 RepID=UPI0039E1472C
MDPMIPIAIIAALCIGLGAGWLAFGRGQAALRAERDRHLENFRQAITDLASAEERAKAAEALRAALAESERGRGEAREALARMEAERSARDQAHAEKERMLLEAKEQLAGQFSEVGGKMLNAAQEQFLKAANERFSRAGQQNEASLKALLQPVETTLKRYEEGLRQVEKERVDSYAGLREAVEQVRVGQTAVKDEAARLVNALRSSPKARGRWGEQQLRNVLEMAGLAEHADFEAEVSVDTGDGRLRPDVVVRLPGGRQLIIDAKCSLNAYLDASDTVDEEERKRFMGLHAAAIRNHATQLGQKAYWTQFGAAADYVVMFIPGEHFLSAALERDSDLWEWAFERRVLLATPTNLIAIARTVSAVWRQEKLAEEAAEIARLGKELHGRLATMGGHLAKVGRNLAQATGAYNAFVGSLESQVMTSAKRLETLKVADGSKMIEELPVVEASPRPLTKLAVPQEDAADAAE